MADKANQPQRKLLLVGLDFQVDIINQKVRDMRQVDGS